MVVYQSMIEHLNWFATVTLDSFSELLDEKKFNFVVKVNSSILKLSKDLTCERYCDIVFASCLWEGLVELLL